MTVWSISPQLYKARSIAALPNKVWSSWHGATQFIWLYKAWSSSQCFGKSQIQFTSYKNLFSSHYLYEVWSSSQHYWKSQIQFTSALKADPVHNALENSDSIPLDAVGTKNIRKHNVLTLINRGLFCSVQLCAPGKHVTTAQIIE